MALKEEIAEKRKDMVVDSYPMSIGEVMNLYKDGELDVHPEFQRFFKELWKNISGRQSSWRQKAGSGWKTQSGPIWRQD